MKILNLTQHKATPEQIAQGVIEPLADDKARISELLTFHEAPSQAQISGRAKALSEIVGKYYEKDRDSHGEDVEAAMIGGAPFLMGRLEEALLNDGFLPLYSFSKRESAEAAQPDGTVKKVSVFKHVGFVNAFR